MKRVSAVLFVLGIALGFAPAIILPCHATEIDWELGCDATGANCVALATMSIRETGEVDVVVRGATSEFVLTRDGATTREQVENTFSFLLESDSVSLSSDLVRIHSLSATDAYGRDLLQLLGPGNALLGNFALGGGCSHMDGLFSEPRSSGSASLQLDPSALGTCSESSPSVEIIHELWTLYMRACAMVQRAQSNQCATSCIDACGENGVARNAYLGGECGIGGSCDCTCNEPEEEEEGESKHGW